MTDGSTTGVSTAGAGSTGTRRDRARGATLQEIKSTARSLLVEEGVAALTLRAIARKMGLTAPALYRYFDSHEDLVSGLCADLLAELIAELEAARDSVGAGSPYDRLGATCRAFRRWALAHPREFQLTFASPGAGPTGASAPCADGMVDGSAEAPPADLPLGDAQLADAPPAAALTLADLSFGGVFLGVFMEIWDLAPFPVLAESEMDPELLRQLARFRAAIGDLLPIGALHAYLAGWVRLYGAVTIEVFGHLGFAFDDAESMFESMLTEMGRSLGAPVDSRPR